MILGRVKKLYIDLEVGGSIDIWGRGEGWCTQVER